MFSELLRDPLLSRFGRRQRTTLPEQVLCAIVDRAQEGVLVGDMRSADAQIVYVNAAFEAITGYAREEAVGKNCRYLQGSDRLQPEIGLMREALAASRAIQIRLRNYRKDGSLFWNDLHLAPVTNVVGELTHYVGFIRDVTETVEIAARLKQITHADQLTGCLNRDGLVEPLSNRTKSGRVLLIKVDISRFHEINGGYGYDTGDALLRATAQRLMALEADLVARVGNDQFALAFEVGGEADVKNVLERLTISLAERFLLLEAISR